MRRQRVAAYALVLRPLGGAGEEEVLLTQLSERTTRPGAWTLPGGGLLHGEDPRGAVCREVREETGLDVTVGALLDVHSLHLEGVAPDGVLEDYHAIRLVFDAAVSPESPDPWVLEPEGTTADARWVRIADLEGGRLPHVGLVPWALERRARSTPNGL
ncbi:MAG: NUDIX domain-containing protein [Nocardioidaceae bacterium]|nr:NUDIX domain-containing protein [Nocardioidaceae bacterium]